MEEQSLTIVGVALRRDAKRARVEVDLIEKSAGSWNVFEVNREIHTGKR